LANILLVAYAAISSIRLARAVSLVVIGFQRDDRLYAYLLHEVVTTAITLAAVILLILRRPFGWFLALTASIYKVLSISGLHAFSALALGPDSLPRGWLLGVLLWTIISLILAHPRVRHACEVEPRIWIKLLAAAGIALTLTGLAFWAPGWDLRATD
jgi:hypothetical protein